VPELILLCAGAAVDRATSEGVPDALATDSDPVRRQLAGGAFARAFARARCTRDHQDEALLPRELPHEAWWRERCAPAHADAIEAYAALALGASLPSWRMTPVHLHLGLDHARLTPPQALALRDEESQALAQVATERFAMEDWRLVAATPQAWFLEGAAELQLETHSWTMAAGRNVDAYLPKGPDARRWRRVLTEIQMSWFAHPVNTARESRGELPLNMLWIDGRASGTSADASGLTVLSSDAALVGLVRAAGGRAIDPGGRLPEARRFAEIAGDGDLAVDVGAWNSARRSGDPGAWLDAWLRLEEWLANAGLDRGLPPGFSALRAVLTGERRSVELLRAPTPWWRWRARLDPVGLVL